MDILFKNATIVTVDDDNFVIENGFLGVDGNEITYLSNKEPKILAKREIDAKGKVLMPGLINSHTHIPMSVLRGFADDYDLQDWLYNHIFKAEAKLDEKCVEIGAKLSIAEMLMTGTTSITDMYFKEPTVCKVLAETLMRGNVCNGSLWFGEEYDPEKDNSFKEFNEMIENYHNFDDGRIKVDAALHAEYTSNPSVWKFWSSIAKEKGLNMHLHLSETKSEHENCKEKYGKTPTEILSENGVFDVPTNLAHCVFIEPSDMDLIKAKNGSVVHNPVSNLKLASGIANVSLMLEKGLNVCLGTDGVASNNTHDLFEEIKLSALLAKGSTNKAKALPAKTAIKMATINGAKAQGRDDIGILKIGNKADIIMIDFENLAHTPTHDVVSSLCYNTSGRDVLLTMVNGKILYENGEFTTIDIKKVKEELESYVLPRIK